MIHASVGGAMKNATNWWPRITSAVLLLLISSSPDLAFAFDPQESAPNQAQQKSPAPVTQDPASVAQDQDQKTSSPTTDITVKPPNAAAAGAESGQLPDSPGVGRSQPDTAPQPAAQQPTSPASSSSAQKPVGTAAAEAASIRGTGASKPAGIAIAPGKQHQARSLLIKIGAILGAGAAVGTVMALSMASPSKPPGAK